MGRILRGLLVKAVEQSLVRMADTATAASHIKL
jgi:hypothetical protein